MAEQDTSHTDVLKAFVDAADVVAKLWMSYLGILAYLALAVIGVKHVDLFLQNRVKLPFLSVDLPLIGFFWLGPLIVILMHLWVLHHITLLALRAERLARESPQVEREQLPVNLFVQLLVGTRQRTSNQLIAETITAATLILFPVGVLTSFALQFLPYHGEAITWWLRLMVVIDLALLWWLWPPAFHRRAEAVHQRFLRSKRGAGLAMLTASVAYLVIGVATFPGEWLDVTFPPLPLHETLVGGTRNGEAHASKTLWSNRLLLASTDVFGSAELDTPAKLANRRPSMSLGGRHLEQAVLTEARLGRVDFTGAHLEGASLVRTHAEGAWFDFADLSGAQLDGAELEGASFFKARLVGATMEAAQLQGARMAGADMQTTWLPAASLDGASLAGADLRRATLDGAKLRGASLNETRLQGASLAGADLHGASIVRTYLWKADFRHLLGGAHVQMADVNPSPDAPCGGDNACDPSETMDRIRTLIERNVPESGARAGMLARSWMGFKAHGDDPWEEESRTAFKQLGDVSKKLDLERAELWSGIACTGKGSPFVIEMLIDTYEDIEGWTRPLSQDGTDRLVRLLREDKCAAKISTTEALTKGLMDLRREDKPPVARNRDDFKVHISLAPWQTAMQTGGSSVDAPRLLNVAH